MVKTQDQEATVEVIKHREGNSYYEQGGSIIIVPFAATNKDLFYYSPHSKTLLLGGENL